MAVLMVVVFHASLPAPGGFVGVDVFFVISGFVITGMLHREWHATGGIDLRSFYVRRFKRLTPALAVTVTFTLMISALVLSPFGTQQDAAITGFAAMVSLANFAIAFTTGDYFDGPAEANPLLNTWSLSVEEQFYLVFPLALFAAWRLARRLGSRAVPFALVAGIAGMSFVAALLGLTMISAPFAEELLGFYSPVTRAWEFAAGSLLALATARGWKASKGQSITAASAGALMLAGSLWLITPETVFPGSWALLPVVGTGLVLIAGTTPGNFVTRALSTRPMVAIGDWSYSIYLWHWPFIVLAAAIWPERPIVPILAAVASLAPALISYFTVEQPIRSRPIPGFGAALRLVMVTLGIPLVASMALFVAAKAEWWLDWDTRATKTDHVAFTECTDRPFAPDRCTWEAKEGTRGSVLLAGDSQAYALADGVIEASSDLGLRTVVTSRSGCPFALSDTTGSKPLDCSTWQTEVLDYALRNEPDVVVIANRSTGYTNDGWRALVDTQGQAVPLDKATSYYADALESVVAQLRDAGIGVVLIQNIPEPGELAQGDSLLRRAFPALASQTFNPADTLGERSAVANAEQEVAMSNPGTVIVDPAPVLCHADGCDLQSGGRPVYLDPWHVTRDGSLLLAPQLGAAIKAAEATRESPDSED